MTKQYKKMIVKEIQVSKSGLTYRIVDDIPAWGAFSIEVRQMYGDCEVWQQVYPESGNATNDYQRVLNEFNKLIGE